MLTGSLRGGGFLGSEGPRYRYTFFPGGGGGLKLHISCFLFFGRHTHLQRPARDGVFPFLGRSDFLGVAFGMGIYFMGWCFWDLFSFRQSIFSVCFSRFGELWEERKKERAGGVCI